MNKLIATFFGVGYLKPAPGTWGSLAALPVAYAVLSIGGFWLLVNLTFFVFMSGWIATREITKEQEDHDPSYIVVDEVVGQWIALFPVAYGASRMSADLLALYPGWIAAFVLFRLFDIWKPWLVGRADARGDALGVMLDDVIAGVFAAVGVVILGGLSHAVM
jgi:phosphatidylglycerophosphatase A